MGTVGAAARAARGDLHLDAIKGPPGHHPPEKRFLPEQSAGPFPQRFRIASVMIADPNRHGSIASFCHDTPKTIHGVIYIDFVARFPTIICIPFFFTRRTR
jgi:hypothetical protein